MSLLDDPDDSIRKYAIDNLIPIWKEFSQHYF